MERAERVDFHGRFFQMNDCVCDPKPLSSPRPDLICAGQSDRGFQFSVREADACFIGGRTQAERREHSLHAKAVAAKLGKTIKTYAMCTVVHGETDAKAEAIARRYDEAADTWRFIIANMLRSWGVADGRRPIGAPKACRLARPRWRSAPRPPAASRSRLS